MAALPAGACDTMKAVVHPLWIAVAVTVLACAFALYRGPVMELMLSTTAFCQ